MEFNAHKPIYLQICSQLYEQILRGDLKADDRIPSVRDYGIQLGVNPNTIMRSYETMTNAGIIYNKRGIGYFIAPEAKDIVLRSGEEDEAVGHQPRRREKRLRAVTFSDVVPYYEKVYPFFIPCKETGLPLGGSVFCVAGIEIAR